MEVQLIYFKASGKYYSDALLELTHEEKNGYYFNLGDRIRKLSEQKSLPGIIGDWLGSEENGFAVVFPVEVEGEYHIGFPILVKKYNNKETLINNKSFTPGAKTNHIMKVRTFKQHGKFDDVYDMPLDSECISEGVALTYKISNMFCSNYPKRRGYIMVECPETLSGCPHLILPSINPCDD
ncbi:hypothetical protein CAL7716_102670 (plasmid) [Calothrix sp. PCC 7716]|nr:hypothetical protein CAL7716_102670 [Calothrix sp. PCC 7716]